MNRKDNLMDRSWQAIGAMSLGLLALWAPSQSVAQQKPAEIRVVEIPIANYTPLLVARDKGYFGE